MLPVSEFDNDVGEQQVNPAPTRTSDQVAAELKDAFGLEGPTIRHGLSQDELFEAAVANDRGQRVAEGRLGDEDVASSVNSSMLLVSLTYRLFKISAPLPCEL